MAKFLAFGEILLRLSPPGRELIGQSPRFDTWVGGAEANVATQLARLGHDVGFASRVPDNDLGRAAITTLRGHGVNTTGIQTGGERMGLYFVTSGAGLRATDVIYDRAWSAFAEAPVESWDWGALLQGVDRLHLSGITPALGPQAALGNLDEETVLADADRAAGDEARGAAAVEHGAEAHHQRGRRQRQRRVMPGGRRRPAAQFLDRILGRIAPSRQFVDLGGDRGRQLPALDDPRTFQALQPLGQHLGADSVQRLAQPRKAAWPEHQFANHEQRPPLADEFHREGGSTGVFIPPAVARVGRLGSLL